MGRQNKSYSKDLHQQAYDRLKGMHAFGESRKAAVADGTEKDKIFSYNTCKSDWKHTKYFIKYIKEKHPECTTLKSARKYVNEWFRARADQGLSAWTVQLEAKALGKLCGIQPDDENYFKPPKRNRGDIKRSRGDRVRDRHFSKTNNDELIKFCRGTGLRRSELGELRGKDLVTREQIEKEIARLEAVPEEKLEEERRESAYQCGLNKNLLRIARERANAGRKLKSEHTGYIVTASEEKEYHYYRAGKKWKKGKLWETVRQSYYSVDFTEEEARTQIERDLFPKRETWLIGKIGISGRYGEGMRA